MAYKLRAAKDELYNKGFHYNKLMSDTESSIYSLRFPVLKYNKIPTLECELSVELQTGDIIINVFNGGTNEIYPPFYNNEYGNYDKLLHTINKAIEKELRKIGAKQVNK